ncbi:MAG: hypothetical protein P4L84_01230 [Isosphaeraceae bacterium]|nr:hypothetical protein [Isosphaeraceae bacterium]
MRIHPYHSWAFLAALLVQSASRVVERSRRELAGSWQARTRWVLLVRMTTEELDGDLAHRYRDLAGDLGGERDVGYFSEQPSATLWSDSSPEGFSRIQRYYMAQGILPPSLLRLDERWPRIVVDCRKAEEAAQVVSRMRLTAIRDYGPGLLLARPGE